jgi:hypothetical protein
MTRDDDNEDHIDMRPLLRIGAWGVCAVAALGAAVFAARTEAGGQRVAVALAALKAAPGELTMRPANVLATRPTMPENDAVRLAETVRTLAADRDRLTTRVAALEHFLSEMTGSVARDTDSLRAPSAAAPASPALRPDDKADPSPPAPIAAPSAQTSAPSAQTSAPSAQASAQTSPQTPAPSTMPNVNELPPLSPEQPTIGMPVNVPLPRPGPLAQIQSYVSSYANTTRPPEPATRLAEAPAGSDATASANPAPEAAPKELAIDLAAATNVNALRARWGTIKGAHPALLEGLRPLVSVRESSRPGFTEFHLVVGPIADAAAADRLCAALVAARAACRPSVFDGQRLDLR